MGTTTGRGRTVIRVVTGNKYLATLQVLNDGGYSTNEILVEKTDGEGSGLILLEFHLEDWEKTKLL